MSDRHDEAQSGLEAPEEEGLDERLEDVYGRVETDEVEEAEEIEAEPVDAPDDEPDVLEDAGVAVEEVPPEELPEEEEAPEHAPAPAAFSVPDGYSTLTGSAEGGRRTVGVVVSRFNGEITSRLLERALEALEEAGVQREFVTVMPVPGSFELPLAAMALAKTRRFACVVALGCVIRGETPHFDLVAGEAASGLQLSALETGVPVAFGVLTCDTVEQAEARIERAADAARGALEMADLFAQLRATANAR